MVNQRLHRKRDGKEIPLYYKGDRYNNMRDLASYLGLTLNQVKWILTDKYRGELYEKDVTEFIENHFIGRVCYLAFGKGFNTFEEMSSHLNLPANVLHSIFYKLKDNQIFEEEVMKRYSNEPIVFEEVEYETLADFCRKKLIDYSLFFRRLREGMSFEEALYKKSVPKKGKEVVFREKPFMNMRELFNYYGFSRTMEGSLMKALPECDVLESFDMYLNFIEENGLKSSSELLTALPMVYYEGKYYMQALKFYEDIGINSRNVNHEKSAKENIGLNDEEIILRMSSRINKHNGEKLFPNCNVNPDGKLLLIKKRFKEYVNKRMSI